MVFAVTAPDPHLGSDGEHCVQRHFSPASDYPYRQSSNTRYSLPEEFMELKVVCFDPPVLQAPTLMRLPSEERPMRCHIDEEFKPDPIHLSKGLVSRYAK